MLRHRVALEVRERFSFALDSRRCSIPSGKFAGRKPDATDYAFVEKSAYSQNSVVQDFPQYPVLREVPERRKSRPVACIYPPTFRVGRKSARCHRTPNQRELRHLS